MRTQLDTVSGQTEAIAGSVRTPFTPTRRQVISLLATGALLAGSGCVGSADLGEESLPAENQPASDPRGGGGGAPVQDLDRPSATTVIGEYRGETTVELLVDGERRSVQSPVEVSIYAPLEYDGLVETNPFQLYIRTPWPGEVLEGQYAIASSALYSEPPVAPGIVYEAPPQWLEQHWDLTFDDGRLAGTLSNPNNRALANGVWYGYTTTYGDFVQVAIFHPGTALEGTIDGDRFTATISGQSSAVEAFRITVTAERPRI